MFLLRQRFFDRARHLQLLWAVLVTIAHAAGNGA
jgi:hypothetical protein